MGKKQKNPAEKTKKQVIKSLEANPAATIRQGVSIADASIFLEHVDSTITDNAAAGLPLLGIALKATRETGLKCLHIRTITSAGDAYRNLRRFERSGRLYDLALRRADGCLCCVADIRRRRSRLLFDKGQRAYAIAESSAVVEMQKERGIALEYGKALLTRGTNLLYDGQHETAIKDFREAIDLIPPLSCHHPAAVHAYGFALYESNDLDNLEEADRLLPEIQKKYEHITEFGVVRAKTLWLVGGVPGRRAILLKKAGRLKNSWEYVGMLARSITHLKQSKDRFKTIGVTIDVTIDVDALEMDICAMRAAKEAYWTAEAELRKAKLSAPFRSLKRRLTEISENREGADVFWATLARLRELAVEMGASFPAPLAGLTTP